MSLFQFPSFIAVSTERLANLLPVNGNIGPQYHGGESRDKELVDGCSRDWLV